jgi:Uma2 family endonuclease
MILATSPPAIEQSIRPEANEPLLLNVSNIVLHITPEEFDNLCVHNPDLRLELTKDGELIVMPPTGFDTGEKNSGLNAQIRIWSDRTKLGRVADSSTLHDFTSISYEAAGMYGGGKLSPDVSWIEESRLAGVETAKFLAIVPDFVIELRSPSDNLKPLQKRMQEYQRLGVRLGLLIDPKKRRVEVYRLGKPMELLASPRSVNCEDVLPGFTLDLVQAGIWPEPKDLETVKTTSTAEQLAQNEGSRATFLRLLNRKLGDLTSQNQARIAVLDSERLSDLTDKLLDFENQQDLENWLLSDIK